MVSLTMSTVTVVKNDVEGDVQRRHLLAEAPPEVAAALVAQQDVHPWRIVEQFLWQSSDTLLRSRSCCLAHNLLVSQQ
jgi:hypothetical protein